jgi:lipoprotein-anchoring transpeptidase ErfK/SrfK
MAQSRLRHGLEIFGSRARKTGFRCSRQQLSRAGNVLSGWVIMQFWLVLLMAVGSGVASAQAQVPPPKDEMSIEEQPGYQPTPEEENLPPQFQRQLVFYRTVEPPGTIVVSTSERFLYVVQGNNRAMRYGIGVGREGFQWQGLLKISRKAEWPDWIPPPEMITRQPYLPRFMGGGPGNPLGARALYLGATIYRIHGTNQPQTIGHAVSSGCFRLVNKDVIDLYDRVPVGTKVVVRQAPEL